MKWRENDELNIRSSEILLAFDICGARMFFSGQMQTAYFKDGTRMFTNWQNVNSVLQGSDTVPTKACLTGNGILRGSDAFQPVGYPNGNNILQGSDVIQPNGTQRK
jgi:hypothetical protein